MSAQPDRKEPPADGGPWVSIHKAQKLLEETRDRVLKRALTGEIRVQSLAHVVLLSGEDIERIRASKSAAA